MADGKRARVLDFFIAIDCKKAASQTDGASDPRPSETAQKLHKRGWRKRKREGERESERRGLLQM